MCWINDVFMNVILCVLILPASISLDNEGYAYLLATAMYMADAEGKYVLLDDALPPSIDAIIREHALSLLNPSERSKTIIKVVPRPHHLQPFIPNPNILRVDLREMTSRKHFMSGVFDSLKNFWDHKIMRKETNNKKKAKQTNPQTLKTPILKSVANNSDNVMDAGDSNYTTVTDSTVTDGTQSSVTERADEDTTIVTTVKPCAPAIKGVQWVNAVGETKDNEETWLENPKPTSDGEKSEEDQPTRQNGYVPTDIYYSIEKKCANWSDGCQLKSPSILDQPASALKYYSALIMQPKKNLWNL